MNFGQSQWRERIIPVIVKVEKFLKSLYTTKYYRILTSCRVLSRHPVVCMLLLLAVDVPVPLDFSSVLQFHGDSYVKLKLSNNVAKTFAYDIWFLPTKSDGKTV